MFKLICFTNRVSITNARREKDKLEMHRESSNKMLWALPKTGLLALFHCTVRFSTAHFWLVFHWV